MKDFLYEVLSDPVKVMAFMLLCVLVGTPIVFLVCIVFGWIT